MKVTLFAVILLIITFNVGWANQPCSVPNYAGHVFSTRIVAALGDGIIPINDDQDSQCYNYSLPFSFANIPSVAISVHDFQTQVNNGMFFFVKPLHTQSLSFVPMVVRTIWSYSQWNQISFSFLAEDRNDIEAGYYQIDTGILSGCDHGKSITTLIPFKSSYHPGIQIKHSVFLHGFEVSSIKMQGGLRSPLQFQIYSSAATISGIQLTLTVTTSTLVNSIYISYVAFQTSTLEVVGGGFVYDATENPAGLFYAPENNIPRNFARLYGITGFLINYTKQRINYATKWDGFTFTFDFGVIAKTELKYFSFSYLFFTGSICQDCPGSQIQYNGTCYVACPLGSYKTDGNTCVVCGQARQWNGTACVTSCPQSQYLNPTSGLCECPPTLNWDGSSCISCLSGRVWSKQSRSCQCQRPLQWNGFACARIQPCTAGKVWDVFSYSCQCPQGTYWNGALCQGLPQCRGGQILNQNYACVCLDGYIWMNQNCMFSPCVGGQIWSGSKCVCSAGLNFNGSMCIQCINGQKWDSKKLACSCDSGYRWNGQLCQKSFQCTNGRVWNPAYQQCICPDGSYWAGYNCLPVQKCLGGQYFDSTLSKCICMSGFQWDGKFCVQCNNGRVWNVTTLTCSCPPGTQQILNGCRLLQQCTGGKQWSPNSWTCECPLRTVWNGNYCIANPCQYGQRWNQTLKSCQCPDGKVFINQACVPPQISCTNGRVWNQNIYACSCPANTFPNQAGCDPIPVCIGGKVYNPLNNQCQCPFGLAQQYSLCADPKCPVGQFWNGVQCQLINCPPPSYFLKDRCIYGGSQGSQNSCGFGYIWNGVSCSFYPRECPGGSTWSNLTCASSKCGNGYYQGAAGQCVPFPQQCPPPNTWDGSKCQSKGNLCPKGTFSQGNLCMPYEPCKNGFIWDPNYIRCVCPPGTINNGNRCVQCANDQKWIPGVGCACPDGSFDSGAACQYPNPNKCLVILNSFWNDNKCRCKSGFTKVGFQCICYGTQVGDFCDKCSYKPNSKLNQRSNTCQCQQGFTQIRGFCVRVGDQIGNDDPNKCAVGTYFQKNHKACLACPAGCLSCQSCYTCRICKPQFIYDPSSQTCIQLCGDGKKFSLECDDGNNVDGDGCSRDCSIQSGYTCTGGSPQYKDNCFFYRPDRVQIQQVGQIRRQSSISLNIKLNYFPNSLLLSQDCSNKCNQILTGQILQGEKNVVSIISQYLPGSKYLFSLTIQFGRSYMARFKMRVSINSSVQKYFGGIQIQPLQITIEPSYLMAINTSESSDVLS